MGEGRTPPQKGLRGEKARLEFIESLKIGSRQVVQSGVQRGKIVIHWWEERGKDFETGFQRIFGHTLLIVSVESAGNSCNEPSGYLPVRVSPGIAKQF